jgi:hypothetical protein
MDVDKELLAQISVAVVVFTAFVGAVLIKRRKYIEGSLWLLFALAVTGYWLNELYEKWQESEGVWSP